jgi:hypothetical protein
MGYLRLEHNSRLVFNPTYPEINPTVFPKYNWTEFYGDVEQAIPPDIPPPLSNDVNLCMMVDNDNVGDKKTRHSRTGFLIFCNLAPIGWLSKKQATIETSVFDAEFVWCRICCHEAWYQNPEGTKIQNSYDGDTLDWPIVHPWSQ